MKYMILTFASQQDYQEMVGQPSGQPVWTQQDYAGAGGVYARRSTRSCSTRGNWWRQEA